MTPFLIIVFVVIITFALLERTGEVKREIADEALERGDKDEVEEVENVSDEEIIENYEDRL